MRDGRHLGDNTDTEQLELLFAEATAPEAHSPRQGEGMVPPETVEIPMREEDSDLAVVDADHAESTHQDLTGLLDELSPGVGSVIAGAFRRMELAEDEIADAKRRDPGNAGRIDGAFRYLRPTEILQRKGDPLYRAHCQELIGRVAAGAGEKELSVGTRAEVVATLADLSLAAPLERTAARLYGRLFAELFPEKAREIDPPLPEPAGRWETEQADELEGRFRRKLATSRAG